jgi:hypothetical protein
MPICCAWAAEAPITNVANTAARKNFDINHSFVSAAAIWLAHKIHAIASFEWGQGWFSVRLSGLPRRDETRGQANMGSSPYEQFSSNSFRTIS